ncbi:hypothetical protein D3C85_641860 [compost metagenome]
MALVLREQVPGRAAVGANGVDDLIGFRGRHARVVAACRHQQGNGDPAHAGQRRDGLQLRALRRIALIPVFHPTQIATIGLGVLQEGHEVGDGDIAVRPLQPVAVVDRRGVAHVAAVGDARDRETVGVQTRILLQIIEEGADVLHRILTLERAVVEVDEPRAIARRAAHIGEEDGHAQFVQQIVL